MPVNALERRAAWLLAAAALVLLIRVAGASSQPSSLERLASLDGPAQLVAIDGPYAYVSGGETLRVIDLSDRTRPIERGSLAVPDRIYGLHVADQHVYLAIREVDHRPL